MQNLDRHVVAQAREWLGTHTVWLCTVLGTFGSSPRPPGAMMAISASGQFCGSLSGGCVEEDFIARLRDGDFRLDSQVVRYGAGGLTPDRALPCGGILDILIECLPPAAGNRQYLERLGRALEGNEALRKVIALPGPCRSIETCPYSSSTIVRQSDDAIILTIAAPPRLVIAGLSAVALCCAEFAVALGFETIVCENRADMLDNFADALSPSVRLERVFPAKYIEDGGCHDRTAIVALTHDPRMDDLTMMEAVNSDAFYLGVMGSVRNSRNRIRRLAEIGGLTKKELQRIHAPVGLQIGSKTPAEIALAVMADIVRLKNHPNPAL